MASQAQIEANRKNAKKSTGPKSENEKSVAKLNAVKHGLTAEHVIIPGEDLAELEELRRSTASRDMTISTADQPFVSSR